MRFKTDENLPIELTELLRQHQHDALSVQDQQMAGRAIRASRWSARPKTGRL